jgi:hypothetical protein
MTMSDETVKVKCQFCGDKDGKRFAENYVEAIPPSHVQTRIVTLAVCSDCFAGQFEPNATDIEFGIEEPTRYTIDDRKILGYAPEPAEYFYGGY